MLKALNQAAGSAAIGNIRVGLGTHFTTAVVSERQPASIALGKSIGEQIAAPL